MGVLDGLVGAIVGGGASLIGGQEANAANSSLNNSTQNFYSHMSDTAHQREVADLKAAGLNPILSAGGSGASSASPSQIPMQNTIGPAVSSALSAYSTVQQGQQADAQIANTNADTASKLITNPLLKSKLEADIASARSSAANQAASATKTSMTTPSAQFSGRFWDAVNGILDKMVPNASGTTSKGVWQKANTQWQGNNPAVKATTDSLDAPIPGQP